MRRAPLALALALAIAALALATVTAAPAAASASTAARVLPSGGVGVEAAALLLSGQQGGDLPVAVLASAVGLDAAGVRVALVVDVAGVPLLRGDPPSPLYVEVSSYVLGSDGQAVLGALLSTVAVDLDAGRAALAAGGLKLVSELVLPPGDHLLRVLVRVPNGALALRALPLSVPPLSGDGPVLLGPFFAETSSASWLTVAPTGAAAPLFWGSDTPAALPILVDGQEGSLRVLASAGLAEGPWRVELRQEDLPVAELPAAVTGRHDVPAPEGPAPGLQGFTLAFTPRGVPVGDLAVRVLAGEAASAPQPAVLAPRDFAESWVALLAAAGVAGSGKGDGAAATPPATRSRRRQRLGRELIAHYRTALGALAGGDLAGASDSLVALESPRLAAEGVLQEELAELELEEITRLAAVDADAVLPILGIYLELYVDRLRAHDTQLATHAREMVFHLAALYSERVDSAEGRRVAARAMLAYVHTLPPYVSRAFLTRGLRQALEYEPQSPDALLAAAINAERHADYAAAVEWLQTLQRLDAQHLEARLRLAVNRGRLGDRRRARSLLAGVLAAPGAATSPPPWWLPVAYQELALLHLAGKDLAGAEGVLRRGLARLPHEEKLSLLLALVLEQRGQWAQARGVLDELVPSPDRAYDSARHRYTQLPLPALRSAADELAARAAAGRPRLLAALAATAHDGEGR